MGIRARNGEAAALIELGVKAKTDKCMIWPFAKGRKGHGVVYRSSGTRLVHRIVCIKVRGKPPKKNSVAEHLCGNAPCFNGQHVDWGTVLTNNRRRTEHGTQNIGSRNPQSKLTEKQVHAIRRSNQSANALAIKYGVIPRTIRNVRSRNHWKHVPWE